MSSKSFFSPAPTAVLPAPTSDQYTASYFGNHYMDQTGGAPMLNGPSSAPNGLQNQSSTGVTTTQGPATSLAGRKRSRGDIFSEVEEDGGPNDDGSIVTPTMEELTQSRGKPVYGPGMTLIYPDDPSYRQAAESQSGTWVEECAERSPYKIASINRPAVTSRKSQRMDSKASISGVDDLAQLVLPHSMREATTEPLIDEATRSLGISWIRMDSSEALQISSRAYARWIQNHYPRLNDVAIWLENSALPAYLVTACNIDNGQREYYIFSNDLTEARLVTTDPSQLIPRLRMLPALELAAPGGKLLAETDPITASQNEVDVVQIAGCAAHAMDMD